MKRTFILALVALVMAVTAHGQQTPVSITSRPTYNGPIDNLWFIADVSSNQTRKLSGTTLLATSVRYGDTAAMLAHLWAAIAQRQAALVSGLNIKTINGNTLLGAGDITISGGNNILLSNWHEDRFVYSGSQTFTLTAPATRVYKVFLFSNSTPIFDPTAVWTFNNGTNQVTVTDALQSGDVVYIDYDSGTATGTIAAGTPQSGQIPIWNASQGTAVWGNQSGGGGSWGTIQGTLANQLDLKGALDAKQSILISGTNIKTINGTSLLGSGDIPAITTQYNLNNIQRAKFNYAGSSSFTLPNTATRVYWVWVFNSAVGMFIPVANFSFNGTTGVTITDPGLTTNDVVYIDYDIGSAQGSVLLDSTRAAAYAKLAYSPITTSDNGKQMIEKLEGGLGTKLDTNATVTINGVAKKIFPTGNATFTISGGGGSGGPTSIVLTTPGVLFNSPVAFSDDGSGNWTATATLANQAAYTILRRASGSGTPSFGPIDSNYFAGNFGPQVQAAAKYVADTTLRTQTFNYTGTWVPWVKPIGITTVEIWTVGGAGGGGGGFSAASGNTRGGGGGGGSSAITRIVIPATLLPDTLWVNVGQGGAGGGPGNAGTAGGATYVSIKSGQSAVTYLAGYTPGAGAGGAGTGAAAGTAGSGGGFLTNFWYANFATVNATSGMGGAAGGSQNGVAGTSLTGGANTLMGGAGGGGVGTNDVATLGGNVSVGSFWNTAAALGGAAGLPGQNGQLITRPALYSIGGGGGGSNGGSQAGNGGNGGMGTGGGGGGGGNGGGTGGKGGDGMVIINAW